MRYFTTIVIMGVLSGIVGAYDGETINVMDFGAVGDGVTDDTNAFKLALAYDANDIDLYIPANTYLVGDPTGYMLIPEGWDVYGDGDSTILKLVSGTAEAFHIQSQSSFSDMKINAIDAVGGGDTAGVIRIGFGGGGGGDGVLVENVTFINCNRTGIVLDGANNVTIQNCDFVDIDYAIANS